MYLKCSMRTAQIIDSPLKTRGQAQLESCEGDLAKAKADSAEKLAALQKRFDGYVYAG